MSRIAMRFAELKARGRKALIPFVTAGDPNPEVTVPLLHTMVEAGADLIEVGVPFSDPMADGPVIQRASERALAQKVGLRKVLEMVKAFRETDSATPIILMGYLNPIENMGYLAFAQTAKEVGVDGVLTVDMPPEEGAVLEAELEKVGMDPIFLLAPTSTDARIERVAKAARGFVYYVSIKGVTGAQAPDLSEVAERVQAIRSRTDLPVGVGFGIKDAESAARIGALADAVVVGSALVSRVEALQQQPEKIAPEIASILRAMRQGLDA
jgi:tryptophan synthase alpha chain